MAEYEEKFIIINKKHLADLNGDVKTIFKSCLDVINKHVPNNKYYVCNQDESYAQEVIDIILKGADNKRRICATCAGTGTIFSWQGRKNCPDCKGKK